MSVCKPLFFAVCATMNQQVSRGSIVASAGQQTSNEEETVGLIERLLLRRAASNVNRGYCSCLKCKGSGTCECPMCKVRYARCKTWSISIYKIQTTENDIQAALQMASRCRCMSAVREVHGVQVNFLGRCVMPHCPSTPLFSACSPVRSQGEGIVEPGHGSHTQMNNIRDLASKIESFFGGNTQASGQKWLRTNRCTRCHGSGQLTCQNCSGSGLRYKAHAGDECIIPER